ncbi:MAG: DUF402 domain-containing protein [Chloroflexota bacterium]
MPQTDRPTIMIRGIYATALTRLLSGEGFLVVRPSSAIAARFGIRRSFHPEEVAIGDRQDEQGIVISGEKEPAEMVISVLRKRLPDAVVRNLTLRAFDEALRSGENSFRLQPGFNLELEFPLDAKRTLDEIRHEQVPTLPGHHQFRSIDSERLDAAEEELQKHPEAREQIARRLKEELVYSGYAQGNELRIEHVKPDGKVLWLSEGEIVSFDGEKGLLTLKRARFKGRAVYDGLRVPKEEGDYAITEAREGAWVLKHRYFARDGVPKGDYFNINTPIEVYPDRIRYIDLEVDVVRWPDGKMKTVDEGALGEAVEAGYLSPELASKALSIARETGT